MCYLSELGYPPASPHHTQRKVLVAVADSVISPPSKQMVVVITRNGIRRCKRTAYVCVYFQSARMCTLTIYGFLHKRRCPGLMVRLVRNHLYGSIPTWLKSTYHFVLPTELTATKFANEFKQIESSLISGASGVVVTLMICRLRVDLQSPLNA